MNVHEEILGLEELAGLVPFSPRRVIEESWNVVEQALRKAFPALARSAENRLVDGATLLKAVAEIDAFDRKILAALETLHEQKEETRSRTRSTGATNAEEELENIAERCVQSGRVVLDYLVLYKPKRRYQVPTPKARESGARKTARFGRSPSWLIVGLALAGAFWLSSFWLGRKVEINRTGFPSPAGVETSGVAPSGVDLLGYWRREDGVILRMLAHPERTRRFVGFVVKAPTEVSGPLFKVGDSVLVLDTVGPGRYKGYQKIAGEENRWKSIECDVTKDRMEGDGGSFDRLPVVSDGTKQ